MRFYMLPTCATLSALLLIYLPLACCCLRGRQRRMVIRPAKSEKDKVGLSKL
ncbi:unnamed protein product [Oikopleura dioica]|nr:unnamed protein product [Oikopleura dioica]